MKLVYRAAWRDAQSVRYAGAADMYRELGSIPFFIAWDFVGKNQAKSKSNFGERCPGAAPNKD
jgi:hypothetical protein